jgi:hypothetical protein
LFHLLSSCLEHQHSSTCLALHQSPGSCPHCASTEWHVPKERDQVSGMSASTRPTTYSTGTPHWYASPSGKAAQPALIVKSSQTHTKLPWHTAGLSTGSLPVVPLRAQEPARSRARRRPPR